MIQADSGWSPPDARQRRRQLAGDLSRGGYIRGSGGAGSKWFETELVLTKPGLLERCALVLQDHVCAQADRIVAGGACAIALATAVALATGVPMLMLEAAPDARPMVRGEVFPGARVILVEDVILTGEHALRSIEVLQAAELEVLGVVCLVDREDRGRARIEATGIRTVAAFRESELRP